MKIFFVLLLLLPLSAEALSLKYYGEAAIPTGTVFKNTKIGGLSALTYQQGTLWALSDDKGMTASTPARFYEFNLNLAGKNVQVVPKEVHLIRGFPVVRKDKTFIDPEGFVRLAGGDFLISSEGNYDRKPRIPPRLFRVSADGVYQKDLSLPNKFLPPIVGAQTRGLQSNEAFEGFTQTADGKTLYAMAESALVTDLPAVEKGAGDWVRILRLSLSAQGDFAPTAEYAYHIDAFSNSALGTELFRGVSEALAVSDTQLLVMERGQRLLQKTWKNTVALYLADLSHAVDVAAMKNLSDGKTAAVSKVKLLDFETDLTAERPGKAVQNFEGLAWGPVLPDGRKTLLVIADNNFSKKEMTEIVVFTVEEP